MAAAEAASMVGVVLSEELPGMLRRRPVLSGGDSVSKERPLNVKLVFKFVKQQQQQPKKRIYKEVALGLG